MATEVVMPQLGESVVEGKVSRWLKKEGDTIKQYEPILEVETDKVTTEVTAAAGGTLLRILVPEGTIVQAGVALAVIGQPGEAVPESVSAPAAAGQGAATPPRPPASPAVKHGGNGDGTNSPRVSPVVARIAAEHHVDVSQIQGTGEGGRVTKKDILAYVEGGAKGGERAAESKEELPPWERPGTGDLFKPTEETVEAFAPPPTSAPPSIAAPVPPGAPPGSALPAAPQPQLPGDEVMPLSSIRRSIAEHMVRSKTVSAHVTTVFEMDASRIIAHREKNKAAFERDGARLTFTPYFVAASTAALKAYPQVNSTFMGDGLVLHRQINIGIAVSLGDEGLIVPVIKGADGMSLLGLARAVNDLAERARKKQLKPDDVTGSTFTITNHGTAGSLFATPIISQPNVAILGVGAIQKRAVVIDDAIAIRPMVYVGLTFDHRVLDGASADAFVAKVKEALENWA